MMKWWVWVGIGIAAAAIAFLAIPPLIYSQPNPILPLKETETSQQQQQPAILDEGPGLGDRPLMGDQLEDEQELAQSNINSTTNT